MTKQRQALTFEQAANEVKAKVSELFPVEQYGTVEFHFWWNGDFTPKAKRTMPACIGVRLAEMSFVSGNSGCSFLGVEPENLGMFAAIERAIIERMVCTFDEEHWDQEVQDADWRLEQLLKQQLQPETPVLAPGTNLGLVNESLPPDTRAC
jgi:hypothetical protein